MCKHRASILDVDSMDPVGMAAIRRATQVSYGALRADAKTTPHPLGNGSFSCQIPFRGALFSRAWAWASVGPCYVGLSGPFVGQCQLILEKK